MKTSFLNIKQSIFMILISITCLTSLHAAELKKVETELITPTLILETLEGKSLDLKDESGKIVLVQFWATYCTPCRVEMPSMNKLIKKLEADKVPFKIIAVNMGETKAEIQKFVDEVKPEFTILMDSKGENVQAWNVFAAPSNFVIDTKGKIRYTLYGGVEWDSEEITKVIKDLANEKS
jgi:peroxiredoxin